MGKGSFESGLSVTPGCSVRVGLSEGTGRGRC